MVGIPHRDLWSETSRVMAGRKQIKITLWFGPGEKFVLISSLFPQWPLQCQGWKRDRKTREIERQCLKRAAPGGAYCAHHLHDRAAKLAEATRRYLMWVLAGAPEVSQAKPLVDLITIEGVTTELLRRERPVVPDKVRLEAATLLLKTTQWLDSPRSRTNPKKALYDAGFDTVQVETAYEVLHHAGWLPELLESVRN